MVGRIPGNRASNDLKMLPLNVCQVKICGLAGTGQGWPRSAEVVGPIRRRDETLLPGLLKLEVKVGASQVVLFPRRFL